MSELRVDTKAHLSIHIMQICPCNVDPLTSHFYIVKFGFTGVYIMFALKLSLRVPTIYVLYNNKENEKQ